MNLAEALNFVAAAFADLEAPLTDAQRAFLTAPVREPRDLSTAEKRLVLDAKIAVMDRLVRLGLTGATCGPLSRVSARFGRSLEENYGLSNRAFLDLAKTYWTFKLEIGDLTELAPIPEVVIPLGLAEQDFAAVFFPTPGPAMVPVAQRREGQRQLLETHWPSGRVEEFLTANPILTVEKQRQSAGCLSTLVLALFALVLLASIVPH